MTTNRRHRTTHTYLVHPDDLSRFAALGVVADLQAGPDSTDTGYHAFLSDFIGSRAFDLIPARTLLDAGAPMSLSSDWDADPLPPLGTIERALRRETNAVPSLEQAIRLVTLDAAYALGHDDRTGSITVGKQADFVVLEPTTVISTRVSSMRRGRISNRLREGALERTASTAAQVTIGSVAAAGATSREEVRATTRSVLAAVETPRSGATDTTRFEVASAVTGSGAAAVATDSLAIAVATPCVAARAMIGGPVGPVETFVVRRGVSPADLTRRERAGSTARRASAWAR